MPKRGHAALEPAPRRTDAARAIALFELGEPADSVANGDRRRRRSVPDAKIDPQDEGLAQWPFGRPEKPDFTIASPEARVYVGDCRQQIPRAVAPGTVDLVFADPPFNWNRAYDKWDDAMPQREYLDFTYHWLNLCVTALRPGGSMWVNIPDDWAAEIVMHLKRRGLGMVNWCIWHYRFGQNTTTRFINSKVHALYFVKPGGDVVWNPDSVLEVSDRRAIYLDPRTESKNDGMPAGFRVPMDVWYGQYWGRIQGNNTERRHRHDNQLPEMYLARVVKCSSNPGDLVLDPFLGSGTTGVVAHALGRRFVGIEFSPENAEHAVERLRAGPVRDLNAGAQSTAIFSKRNSKREAVSTPPDSTATRGRKRVRRTVK